MIVHLTKMVAPNGQDRLAIRADKITDVTEMTDEELRFATSENRTKATHGCVVAYSSGYGRMVQVMVNEPYDVVIMKWQREYKTILQKGVVR